MVICATSQGRALVGALLYVGVRLFGFLERRLWLRRVVRENSPACLLGLAIALVLHEISPLSMN
jgi:hypothetical protein